MALRIGSAELARPGGYGGIPKDRRPRHAWRDLLESSSHLRLCRTRTRRNQWHCRPAAPNYRRSHRRQGRRRARTRSARCGLPMQRRHSRARCGQNDIRRERDQFRREFAIEVGIASSPADVDSHVLTFSPTEFLQALPERRKASLTFRIIRSRTHEHTDPRTRSRCCAPPRAATQPHRRERDELASPH